MILDGLWTLLMMTSVLQFATYVLYDGPRKRDLLVHMDYLLGTVTITLVVLSYVLHDGKSLAWSLGMVGVLAWCFWRDYR